MKIALILTLILLLLSIVALIGANVYYQHKLLLSKYINLKSSLDWCDIVKTCKNEPSFDALLDRRIEVTKNYKEILEQNWLLKIFVLRRENKHS